MKLIDRYLLRTLLVPLAYCLLAFSMVYVIFDLFDNLSDFVEAKTPLGLVTKYYIVLLPSVLYRIVPVAVMLAVIYALYQLSKNNELTAMRACGISLGRLMIPFMATGCVISMFVLAVNETFGPKAAYWCHKFVDEQRHADNPLSAHVFESIAFKKERQNRVWYINTFDSRDYSMSGIEISQFRPRGTNAATQIRAEGGRWLDESWVFTNVTIQAYDPDGSPRDAPEFLPVRSMTEFSERPEDFMNEIKDPEFLSSRELVRYLRFHTSFEPQSVARFRSDMHNRLAFPWASLIVVLLGVPVGTHTGRKGVMPAIASSLGMLGGYYALMMFGLFLAKNMIIAPWIGGWLPIIVFLFIGLALLARLR